MFLRLFVSFYLKHDPTYYMTDHSVVTHIVHLNSTTSEVQKF